MSDAFRDVLRIRSSLHALGYRPLPSAAWPPGAMGAYANPEGDAVVVVMNRFRGLEIRPLDHYPPGHAKPLARAQG